MIDHRRGWPPFYPPGCRRANSFVIILIYAPVSSRRVPTPDTFSRPKYPPLVHTEGGGKEQRSRVSLRRGIFSIIPSSEGTRDQARNTQDCRVTPGSACSLYGAIVPLIYISYIRRDETFGNRVRVEEFEVGSIFTFRGTR